MSVYQGPSESQSIAIHGTRRATSPMYRDVRNAIGWFRFHWTASLPRRLHEGFSTVEPDDVLGAPAWSDRFRRFLTEPSHDPIRQAFDTMARGSLFDRCGAQFLFRLACLDFEPTSAGLAMTPPLLPEYATWYAEKAIARLSQVLARLPEREKPTGARLVDGPPPAWIEETRAVG